MDGRSIRWIGPALLALVLTAFCARSPGEVPVTVAAPDLLLPATAALPRSGVVDLLETACADRPALSASARKLLGEAGAAGMTDPLAVAVTYRRAAGRDEAVCLQWLEAPPGAAPPVLNPAGIVRERIGDDLYAPANQWLSLVYAPMRFLGQAPDRAVRQRAFRSSLQGDMTLLREQTVEPLYLLAVVPQAGRLLPGSLSSRVESLVIEARLAFREWQVTLELVTPDQHTAEHVALVVAATCDLAESLARRYAAAGPGRSLQSSLAASSVRVIGNRVIAAGSLSAPAVVRVSKELMGHAPPDKVTLCHRGHTIEVAPAAVPAHLAHGDTLGPCPQDGE